MKNRNVISHTLFLTFFVDCVALQNLRFSFLFCVYTIESCCDRNPLCHITTYDVARKKHKLHKYTILQHYLTTRNVF